MHGPTKKNATLQQDMAYPARRSLGNTGKRLALPTISDANQHLSLIQQSLSFISYVHSQPSMSIMLPLYITASFNSIAIITESTGFLPMCSISDSQMIVANKLLFGKSVNDAKSDRTLKFCRFCTAYESRTHDLLRERQMSWTTRRMRHFCYPPSKSVAKVHTFFHTWAFSMQKTFQH